VRQGRDCLLGRWIRRWHLCHVSEKHPSKLDQPGSGREDAQLALNVGSGRLIHELGDSERSESGDFFLILLQQYPSTPWSWRVG
jgi:hypothetical protein